MFERHRAHNRKHYPAKAKIAATKADFLGHSMSPNGLSPDADKALP